MPSLVNGRQPFEQEDKVEKSGTFEGDGSFKKTSRSLDPGWAEASVGDSRSMIQRLLSKFKRCSINKDNNKNYKPDNQIASTDMEYAERQNSVGTLDMFKYSLGRERLALAIGIMFMWYAASWQPISVFILSIMATLMGQYHKRISWLEQSMINNASNNNNNNNNININIINRPDGPNSNGSQPTAWFHNPKDQSALQSSVSDHIPLSDYHYEGLSILTPLHAIVGPIFDLTSSYRTPLTNYTLEGAVKDILKHESEEFLRESFQINGSALLLALTQLSSFLFGMRLITWVAKKQASRIKVLYFRSCLCQEVTWFEAIDSGSGSGSSLNALVDKYEDGIGMKLALLVYFLGHVALFTLTAFYQMFKLAAFCMPFVLLVALVMVYLSEWQAIAIGQQALFAKRSLQLAEEILSAIRTVFAFNGQQKECSRYSISLQPVYKRSLIKHLYTALNTSLSKFSVFACFAVYSFYAMHLFPPYDLGLLSRSTVLAVMRGAEVSIVNLLISIPFMEALQQSKGSIARIYAAIERRSQIDPSSSKGVKPDKWAPSISFRMVQFGYAQRSGPTRRRSTLPFFALSDSCITVLSAAEQKRKLGIIDRFTDELDVEPARPVRRPSCSSVGMEPPGSVKRQTFAPEADRPGSSRSILNFFNLDIKPGHSVALVGPSGSGKSTVLALIQRLYDINGGQLLIDQHNIKDLNLGWLRNQIGVVEQEPRLFDLSIAENIRLGLAENARDKPPRRSLDDHIMQQVVEAARAASAHDFITRLPAGYNTRVGSGGVQLSGGQKQRIAIARALIRRPKILLLDESTSALDTESEFKVQEALKTASIGRTTIMVAHRLSTIKHVDLIVVMSRGQVIESGRHEELMKAALTGHSGIYRQMYESQQAGVLEEPRRHLKRTSQRTQGGAANKQEWSKRLNSLSELDVDLNSDDESGQKQTSLEEQENLEDDIADSSSSSSVSSRSNSGDEPSGWQVWRFIEMPKWSSVAAVLVCLLAGLILPLNLIAHSYLFSAFAYGELEHLSECLYMFGLVMLSFSAFVFIVSFLQIILPGYVGEKLSIRLRVKTMESLLNKPMFYFDMDSSSAGALCDRFNSYILHIQNIAGTRVATMLEAVSTLIAGAIFGFGKSLALSLFCLSFALLVLVTTIIESRIFQRESSLQQKFDAKLAHLMADALSNIKTIASLNKEAFFIDRFSEIIRQREVGLGSCVVWLRTFLTSLKFVMPAMSWSASMYYGCHLLVEGRIDLQTIFIVCPVVLFAVNDTFRALVFLPELLKARKSLERLYQMNREFSPEVLQTMTLAQQLQQQNELHLGYQLTAGHESPSEPDKLVNRRLSRLNELPSYMRRKGSRLNSLVPRSQARGMIEFQGVHFAYPNRPSALVLEGFSLSITPGESVALVGASGSGKSTCVAILEKFYDYHAGRVTLDGRDIRLVESNWVRSQIGLVSQEPTLLSYTIADNIRYGDNSRFVSMDEVVDAARTANIHDFIMSLPDTYDTELSTSTHSGSQLSGGQRQRIAIARALIRNAPILVFDEATSALDTKNESAVQDALNKVRRGRTNLTIAHRLATIKDADKIAVLNEGKLVEVGKHDQLMQIENGHYKSLWERQQASKADS